MKVRFLCGIDNGNCFIFRDHNRQKSFANNSSQLWSNFAGLFFGYSHVGPTRMQRTDYVRKWNAKVVQGIATDRPLPQRTLLGDGRETSRVCLLQFYQTANRFRSVSSSPLGEIIFRLLFL